MTTQQTPTQQSTPVLHAGFTLTRDVPVPVSRLFRAFADQQDKSAWFGNNEQWDTLEEAYDFRVGGQEINEGRFHGGPVSRYVATYTDIVEDERIVLTYDMWLDGRHISTSVASCEFEATPTGSRLTHTEHGVHLDGLDDPQGREQGTREIHDALAAYLGG